MNDFPFVGGFISWGIWTVSIFFTTCEKSITHAIAESIVVIFCTRYVPGSQIIFRKALLTEAPYIHTKDMWKSKDCRMFTASPKMDVRWPARRPLLSIYDNGNRKPLNVKNTNWSTVVAKWKCSFLEAVSIPLLLSPKSTYPNIFSSSPYLSSWTPGWTCISSNTPPPPALVYLSVRSLYWATDTEKLIPGDLSIRFLYICTSFSHGRYKVSRRMRYAARLTTLSESARLITDFGHQLLASASVASAWQHLAWVESRTAKLLETFGKSIWNSSSLLMYFMCSVWTAEASPFWGVCCGVLTPAVSLSVRNTAICWLYYIWQLWEWVITGISLWHTDDMLR